jgi:hypothetical protein
MRGEGGECSKPVSSSSRLSERKMRFKKRAIKLGNFVVIQRWIYIYRNLTGCYLVSAASRHDKFPKKFFCLLFCLTCK